MRRGALALLIFVLPACGRQPIVPEDGNHVEAAVASSQRTSTAATVPASQTFLLFADVTRSLTQEEQAAVISTVQTVIGILPPGARLYVFPLLEDVQRASAVFEGELPKVQTTSDAVAVDTMRASWRRDIAEKLRTILTGPPNGRNLTCVSAAFRKAEEITAYAAPGAEIVIVSDMLEDCHDSLLNTPLQLQKRSIQREIGMAESLATDALLRLNGASVTAILPTVPTSGQRVARPPVHELKSFWRAVLDRCGDDPDNYRFGTTVPKRLLDYGQPEEGMI